MLQDPEKEAPGSIESLSVTISPFNFDVDFKFKTCETVIFAFICPATSALAQNTSPSTIPEAPTTSFPSVLTDPFKTPSILMSLLDYMSPLIVVPPPIILTAVELSFVFFIVVLFLFENII